MWSCVAFLKYEVSVKLKMQSSQHVSFSELPLQQHCIQYYLLLRYKLMSQKFTWNLTIYWPVDALLSRFKFFFFKEHILGSSFKPYFKKYTISDFLLYSLSTCISVNYLVFYIVTWCVDEMKQNMLKMKARSFVKRYPISFIVQIGALYTIYNALMFLCLY